MIFSTQRIQERNTVSIYTEKWSITLDKTRTEYEENKIFC